MKPKIFSDAYQLTVQVFVMTKGLPKAYRPTLGRRLEEGSLNLLCSLDRAMKTSARASAERKIEQFRHASDALDEIRVVLQLSNDLGLISHVLLSELSVLTNQIGRELGGLLNHTRVSQASVAAPC